MDAVNAVPVVGQPLAYGIGFGVLLLVVFTETWAGSLVTVAHEGGHMIVAALTFRGHEGFTIDDEGNGATTLVRYHWSIADILTRFAGYPLPPLLGLGGAFLVRDGNVLAVLWAGLALLLAAFFQAKNALATVVTGLVLLGVGWLAVAGEPEPQAAAAVAMVWWMLVGGALYSSAWLSRAEGSDAQVLASRTLVPRIVWHAAWAVIGIVCLWKGARAILAF